MVRDTPQTPAKAAFTYGQLEAALAAVFGIDEAGQKGWLRGRLQHVRRLGLVADSPGRGRTIDYTRDDADKWLVAIELEHFGIDPTKVVELVKRQWNPPPSRKRTASGAFARGEASLADLVAEARASQKPGTDVVVTVQFAAMSALPIVGYTTEAGMASFGQWLAGDRVDPTPRRASVFALSARLRALDAALAEAAKPQPPQPTGLAKEILAAGKRRRGQG